MVSWKPLTYSKYTFPLWSEAIGWCVALNSMVCIPSYFLYKLARARGTMWEVSWHRAKEGVINYLASSVIGLAGIKFNAMKRWMQVQSKRHQ